MERLHHCGGRDGRPCGDVTPAIRKKGSCQTKQSSSESALFEKCLQSHCIYVQNLSLIYLFQTHAIAGKTIRAGHLQRKNSTKEGSPPAATENGCCGRIGLSVS
uniref:Uncharacterized protein n=1 Tax=Photinus pyralis TaxID=7054 RepID=A0A1Y1KJ58_PHOPY